MNRVLFHAGRKYPVVLGGMTLYMTSCKVTGACTVTEQGTADGLSSVTEISPRGTRLEMQGLLPPETDPDSVAAALAAYLREGTLQDLTIGTLIYAQARLWGYTISDAEQPIRMTLKFFVPGIPESVGEGA